MNNIEFAQKIKDVANNYKTLYVMGCFGAPMTASNKTRYCNNHSYNKKAARTTMIKAASADTFGFDCVCLIKGVLWGWCGDKSRVYGGASYTVNGVPDIDANAMLNACSDISTDFSNIEIGEAVWIKDHIGVYVGDGLAVECTPRWKNGVQFTACNTTVKGYNRRNWTKHGKLPYIEYVTETEEKPDADTPIVEVETEHKTKEVCEVKLPVLRKGSDSGYVKTLQILLNKYNNAGLVEDGIFGNGTLNAVITYQKSRKLDPDGIVGTQTWSMLLK